MKHIVIDARIRQSSTGRYAARLLDHLQQIDSHNQYTVLIKPGDPWQPEAANFDTLTCKYAQFSFNPLEQFGFAWQLYKLKPDLVHFTMTQQPMLYFGNIVTTTHDLTMFRFVRRGNTPLPVFKLKMWLYRILFLWSHKKSTAIITPSKYVADDLINYQPSTEGKITVTYEASEPMHADKAVRPKAVKANDRFIMYLGTAFPHKNLQKLIDAFSIIKESEPDLKLVLVGKKEVHYQELEAYARKQKHHKDILITGFLPDEEARWLYEHCLVYAFPSLSEGFGLPAMEAIAHGAAVAAANASCLPEVYGPAAHYFDGNDPADMAIKIREVLNNETLRKKLTTNGKKQLAKYSWRKMAKETLTVYKKLLR